MTAQPSNTERGYTAPPELVSASRRPGASLLLAGTAPALSRVRLASPTGTAVFANAGSTGAWRMVIPAAVDVRLFGLSATLSGRTVQAEGYLAMTPGGEAAQLRSGSGARAISARGAGFALLAADFDRKGGTVLSGQAPAGASVSITVDDQKRGLAKAGADGRFLLALNEPLKEGPHLIQAEVGGDRVQKALVVSAPSHPSGGPFQARAVDGGWQIDWLTPGGGVQSTVLYQAPGTAA